ncbi:acyl-CoA carboxylase subunit epsilon [Gordonia aichiensis]|uniref:Acyl-CoA carboxylase epsilon subunit n=1 Tax=Gordonia aichiensis NBRC 108223 TaxID=1220583 RepID=L7KLJ3_9ACTN|nr:acyl-CoA carboxylase subunit epsilon [Gordonia aichiensis]GAC48568.1 hypothetical protein GOACH_06_00650 [Gordonia aichiensis NBRC 108223]
MSTPQDQTPHADTTDQPGRPVLRVVKGNPTDEEIAVLLALLATGSGGASEPRRSEPRNEWGRPIDQLRPVWGSPSSFLRF